MNNKVYEIDIRNIETKQEFHERLKEIMPLPDYYGNNLDALYDLLTDLYVNEDTIVILMNCRKMKKSLGEYGDKLIEAFANASEEKGFIFIIKD